MTYALREAEVACGHSKGSALRFVKSGTISNTRDAHGGWQLEPVELHRLVSLASAARTSQRKLELAEARVSRVEAELRLALAEVRVSQVEAELTNETQVFDEETHHIKEALDAIPNGSAITFSANQLEVLVSGGRPILADTATTATIIEALANTCGCSFALHDDMATFTKDLINSAASAQLGIPESPIETEREDKVFGKSKGNSDEEDKVLRPVQQLQDLAPTHLAAPDSAVESSIGPGMTVVGKISSEGTVSVYGRVEGELHASIVWIANGAQVEGTIAAQDLTIGGRFKGTIQANCVTLTSSAVVEGEILHRSLKIEENAWFAGISRPKESSVCEVTDPQSPTQPRPALKPHEENLVTTAP